MRLRCKVEWPYEQHEQVANREDVRQVAPVKTEVTDVWSSANLQLKQEEDPGIRETKRLLENFPDRRPLWSELEGEPEETKILWTMWNELRVIDGVLYRISASPNAQEHERRLVVPVELRGALFRLVHEGMSGGHLGTNKTRDQVRQRAYWPGWSKDVELYIQACEPCARFGRGKAPKQGSLHPMTASSVWETLGVGITGPHPRSSNGFTYILTAVDHFRKPVRWRNCWWTTCSVWWELRTGYSPIKEQILRVSCFANCARPWGSRKSAPLGTNPVQMVLRSDFTGR